MPDARSRSGRPPYRTPTGAEEGKSAGTVIGNDTPALLVPGAQSRPRRHRYGCGEPRLAYDTVRPMPVHDVGLPTTRGLIGTDLRREIKASRPFFLYHHTTSECVKTALTVTTVP
jgi:hypothetical protein